jgi:tetratricopeptide (TPR) repeat protein
MNRHHDRLLPAAWTAAAALTMQATAMLGQAPPAMQQPDQIAAIASPEQVGDSLMAHQHYQAAIEEYRKAAPKSVTALNKMGVSYQLMFNTVEAGKCYQAALKREPRNAVAWNNMGSVYMSEKYYATAEKTYKKAVSIDPKSALFRKNLGTALLAERKYKKGWEAYQEALVLDPNIFTRSSSVRVENPSSVQDRGAMNFYMAKGCLKAGMPEKAVYYLRLSLNEGFTTPKKILADAELASLHDNPDFLEMMQAQGVYLRDPASVRPPASNPIQQ